MSSTQRRPDYFYSDTFATLEEHLRKLYNRIVLLTERTGQEPSDLITQWRDDEDFTGWATIIKWPLVIQGDYVMGHKLRKQLGEPS